MINQINPKIWQLYFKEFGSCVYLLNLDKIILIDTSSKAAKPELLQDLQTLKINPQNINAIILTHNHWDHNENLSLFTNSKVYSAKNLSELIKNFPNFKIIQTPGHTKDSICILYKNILFSGDTIFDKQHNYIGRTDLPESNPKVMQKSLAKLKQIKYNILCAGHLV